MSDQSQGPGWWVASDGKWYPPESHPSRRQDPPPPPPRQAPPIPTAPKERRPPRQKSGTSVWKVALGVCLGLFLFIGVCSALVSQGVKDATEKKAAKVRVEAAADVCWSGSIGNATQEGCGTKEFDVESTFGNVVSANAQKRTPGTGALTVVILIDGKERGRSTTTAEFGLAQATSS